MHKTYKLSSKKLNVFAKLVEEQVLPYVKQTDQNIVVLQKNINTNLDLVTKEVTMTSRLMHSELQKTQYKFTYTDDKIDALTESVAKVRLEHEDITAKLTFLEQTKKAAIEAKKKQEGKQIISYQAPSSSKMFTRPLTDVPIQGIKEFALSEDTVPYQDPILGMHFNIPARLKTKKFDSISESKAPSDSEYVIYRSQDEDEEKPGLFHVEFDENLYFETVKEYDSSIQQYMHQIEKSPDMKIRDQM